jgi:carbonic anhydrase
MLELAVSHGVRLIVLTTHTDCAAERAAATAEQRARFPSLMTLLDDRERAIQQFKARPVVAAALSKGELLIKRARIDTRVDELMFMGE